MKDLTAHFGLIIVRMPKKNNYIFERMVKMKKLFISCPMRGRTNEQIKRDMDRMHKIAEIIFDEELKPIDTFFEDSEFKGEPILLLSESLKLMNDADYFIGIRTYDFYGCIIEREVFEFYKGSEKMYLLDDIDTFAPDIVEMLRKENETPKTLYANNEQFMN